MIRILHLMGQRLTNPAVATLLLLVVAFRLLIPPGLMLSPSAGTDGRDFVICSGHGAMFGVTPAISGDHAEKAAAPDLANALASSSQHSDNQHDSGLCPFSAALAIGLATALLVPAHWLRIAASARTVQPADDAFLAAPTHGPLGARAPPLSALS